MSGSAIRVSFHKNAVGRFSGAGEYVHHSDYEIIEKENAGLKKILNMLTLNEISNTDINWKMQEITDSKKKTVIEMLSGI